MFSTRPADFSYMTYIGFTSFYDLTVNTIGTVLKAGAGDTLPLNLHGSLFLERGSILRRPRLYGNSNPGSSA